MGESARTALRGVDFCTRLTHSASAGGPGFRRVALGLGLDPGDIDAATRRSIDFRMAYRFDSAAEAGQSPVPLSKAEEWLQNELLLLTK